VAAHDLKIRNLLLHSLKGKVRFGGHTGVLISPQPDPGRTQATASETYNSIPIFMAYKREYIPVVCTYKQQEYIPVVCMP
jgi:hypothetical protein